MDIRDLDDEYIRMAQMAMEGQSKSHMPGACWVEYFPFLRHIPSWVPGTSSKKLAEKYRPFAEGMVVLPYEQVRSAVVRTKSNFCSDRILTPNSSQLEGSARPCIARTLITKIQDLNINPEQRAKDDALAMGTLAITYAGELDCSV